MPIFDGFTDDMEAVVSDLLRHADIAIRDVPAWIAMRALGATVDANRVRRGPGEPCSGRAYPIG